MVKSPSLLSAPSGYLLFRNRMLRYLRVGYFLHGSALVALICCYFALESGLVYENGEWMVISWERTLLGAFLFTSPIFAEMDAYGRFQNYKQVKDLMYTKGYDERILRLFSFSKCQRDAVIVASKDLGLEKEVNDFFFRMGYRWYHILPDIVVENLLVLLHPEFWKRILFTPYYKLQNFYW